MKMAGGARVAANRDHESIGAIALPRGISSTPSRTLIDKRRRSPDPAVGETSHSVTPGPVGSASPRAVGLSPLRSTSVVGSPCPHPSAKAQATTVVPLPPLAAQQRILNHPRKPETADWGK